MKSKKLRNANVQGLKKQHALKMREQRERTREHVELLRDRRNQRALDKVLQ